MTLRFYIFKKIRLTIVTNCDEQVFDDELSLI